MFSLKVDQDISYLCRSGQLQYKEFTILTSYKLVKIQITLIRNLSRYWNPVIATLCDYISEIKLISH